MKISEPTWIEYKNKLAAISKKAADEMERFMSRNPGMDPKELIGLAYALEERYGDAAAELACEMYDAVAWALTEGISTGVDDTHFAPDKTCTRAEVVTFLWREAGCPTPKTTKNPFKEIGRASCRERV